MTILPTFDEIASDPAEAANLPAEILEQLFGPAGERPSSEKELRRFHTIVKRQQQPRREPEKRVTMDINRVTLIGRFTSGGRAVCTFSMRGRNGRPRVLRARGRKNACLLPAVAAV